MPAPTLITWRGLQVEVAPDGSLVSVSCDGQPVLRDFAVRLAPPWQHQRTELLVDEVEQHFVLESDGALQARAVVRQVFDGTWSLRVQIHNLTEVELSVPAVWLDFEPAWPVRRWLAGAEGQLSVDPGREDGQLLTFTQLRGRSRLSDDRCWLTDMPIRLGPAGTPHAGYQVSWRADWLRDERVQAAALPAWWPERTVLAAGDIVTLSLPDAAIEAAGIQLLEDDDGTTLSAQPGVHLAQVHAGRGTTDVELAWAPDEVGAVLVPRAEELLQRDPRILAAHEVFLLGRALGAGHLGESSADLLTEAVENLAARPGPVSPLGLAAVADEVMRRGAPDLVDCLPDLAARVALVPGAVTALLHATMASRLAGGAAILPMPNGAVAGDTQAERAVARATVAAELQALRPADQPPGEVVRLLALLGAGLPGATVGQVERALIWAVTSALPEHWEVPRWPVSVGECRDRARSRLLAERCCDEALAWLLW